MKNIFGTQAGKMKKIFMLFIFLPGLSLFSKAQDTILPTGKSIIYLLSGKAIKDIRLWSIDSLKIEYVKNGNLGDVRLTDVSMIKFSDGTTKVLHPVKDTGNDNSQPGQTTTGDSIFKFNRFHIYLGKGRNIGSAQPLFFDAFNSTQYQGNKNVIEGIVHSIEGRPIIRMSESVYLGVEYNFNRNLRFGAWLHPYVAFFQGYKGEYHAAYHSLTEEVKGNRYYFAGSYSFLRYTKPFRINISGGAAVTVHSAKVFTQAIFFDTSASGSYALPVDTITVHERIRNTGVQVFGIADIFIGKHFSVFIKPSIDFAAGFTIAEKVLSSDNQMADIPEQNINFSGLGISGGLAVHF